MGAPARAGMSYVLGTHCMCTLATLRRKKDPLDVTSRQMDTRMYTYHRCVCIRSYPGNRGKRSLGRSATKSSSSSRSLRKAGAYRQGKAGGRAGAGVGLPLDAMSVVIRCRPLLGTREKKKNPSGGKAYD